MTKWARDICPPPAGNHLALIRRVRIRATCARGQAGVEGDCLGLDGMQTVKQSPALISCIVIVSKQDKYSAAVVGDRSVDRSGVSTVNARCQRSADAGTGCLGAAGLT